MELRQLQYVVQIAKEKNFSRAAEKLHIAQPSLSQQLSKLEREIGVMLFQRSTNSVELTHAGKLFVDQAQKVLDLVEQIKQEMDDISLMRKGKLVIGSLPITGSHILPRVLPVFQSLYPEIEVTLLEETSSNLEMLTAQGQTDLTLLSYPVSDASLVCERLIEEEILLALPAHHRLIGESEDGMNRKSDHLIEALNQTGVERPIPARSTPVHMAALQNENFIILKKGHGFRQITIDLCRNAGFDPNIVFESSNIETVQSLVAAGMGIALVPEMVARSKWSEFVPAYLRLEGRPSRTLVIAHRKDRYMSKAAKAFIQTMMDVVKGSEA